MKKQSLENKPDIESREDVTFLIDEFYSLAKVDPELGPVFRTLSPEDWEKHLPKMIDFWCHILLGESGYTGNPMEVHLELHKKYPLKSIQFHHWVSHFKKTVNAHFLGDRAELAKERAQNISDIMMIKLEVV